MATNSISEKDPLAALAAELGRRGGKARLTKMTAEERTRIAKLAAQARWGKKAAAPDPTDPKGPKRDQQGEGPGILSSPRISCRPSHAKNIPRLAAPAAQFRLFEAA